jgi:hypothetical protein
MRNAPNISLDQSPITASTTVICTVYTIKLFRHTNHWEIAQTTATTASPLTQSEVIRDS